MLIADASMYMLMDIESSVSVLWLLSLLLVAFLPSMPSLLKQIWHLVRSPPDCLKRDLGQLSDAQPNR